MPGHQSFAFLVMWLWTPIVVAIFFRWGPRTGTLVAVIGGNLMIPWTEMGFSSLVGLRFRQPEAIGLALSMGMLAKEGWSLFKIRPRWLDLPMLIYAVYPIVGLLGRGQPSIVADITLFRVLSSLVPYAAARRYFGDAEGVRRIGIAIVLATVAYVPLCLFEAFMGPKWYVAGWIYGLHYQSGMVERLGGWRPEAFVVSGIALAAWFAFASAIACGLWLGRSWRPQFGPAWGPTSLLVITTIICKGIYGYIVLAIGICAVIATHISKSRWGMVFLMLIPPTYISARVSGVWDGASLTKLAEKTGRSGTVGARIAQENAIFKEVLIQNCYFGFGDAPPWTDGAWLGVLWSGGEVGLAIYYVAFLLLPAGLVLLLPSRRPTRGEIETTTWTMALLLILSAFDSLHNNSLFTPIALVAGSLVSIAALGKKGEFTYARESNRPDDHCGSRRVKVPFEPAGAPKSWAGIAWFALVMLAFAAPESVGLLTGRFPSRSADNRSPSPSGDAGRKPARDDVKPFVPPITDDDLSRRLKEWEREQQQAKERPPH